MATLRETLTSAGVLIGTLITGIGMGTYMALRESPLPPEEIQSRGLIIMIAGAAIVFGSGIAKSGS